MIIFFIIISVATFLLFVNIKLNIKIRVENTISYIEIKFLWIKIKRKGKFVLKTKIKKNNEAKIITENKKKKKRKYNSQHFFKSKFLSCFFKNINYNEVKIYEKIGIIDPFITSMALPIISLITTMPLNYFKFNYKNLKYEIIPDYNNLIFQLSLDANGYFNIIKILKLLILELYLNNKMKVCTK